MKSFGERLHDAMAANGITVAMIAKACDVSRQTVNHWLRMTKADLNTLHFMCLCELLRVHSYWLAYGAGDMFRTRAAARKQKV